MIKKPDPRSHIANITNNTSSVKEVIETFFEEASSGKLYRNIMIRKIWEEIAGKKIAKTTKKIYESKNILFVEIISPVAKAEVYYLKKFLLESFNRKFKPYGSVKKIVIL